MNKLLSALLLITVICNSCKKDPTASSSPALKDVLTSSELQILEAAGVDNVTKFSDALFPDGSNINDWRLFNDSGFVVVPGIVTTASDEKNLFIARMTDAGFYYTGYTVPTQINGLAYVYGSRTVLTPSVYPGATCQQPLFGLDCSGLIYLMAKSSQLFLPRCQGLSGTGCLANISTWNTAIYNSREFKDLRMTSYHALPATQIQAGDIIVRADKHVGMVMNNGSSLNVFNSLGSPDYTCVINSDASHGPYLTTNLGNWLTQLFGSNYEVLRVNLTGPPGLVTNTVSSISQTSAVSGGNITNDGGSPITARGVCWSTSPDPTIANSKTTDGTGTGSFSSSITGLTASTLYYVRAYATNSAGTSYGNQMNFNTTQSGSSSTVTDIDGNVYNTVTIGTQVWMKENLRTGRYRNGDPISTGLSDAQWKATTSGAYSIYNNNPANNTTYGKLYNWYAVTDSRKIAPAGWHIPSEAEWNLLITYLGGMYGAGGKLKAISPLWNSPNTGATNSSGFTAIPAGWRNDGNWPGSTVGYGGIGSVAEFWTISGNNNPLGTAWDFVVYNNSIDIYEAYDYKGVGFSVRCVKD